ncbi:MAG: endo alpha-1,4 polygalactosaminidase [Saprospiraceae bacterium]
MSKTNFYLSLIIISLNFLGCKKDKDLKDIDFRREMVNFVKEISVYAKSKNPNFIIIPQNGEALAEYPDYLIAVDGIGREDLNYGYDKDGTETPPDVKNEVVKYLNIFKDNSKIVIVTDYVFSNSADNPTFDINTQGKIDAAYQFSLSKGYLEYCTVRNLDYLCDNPNHLPQSGPAANFFDAKSFVYYLQPKNISHEKYIQSIANSNYDIVIMDLAYDGLDEWTMADISKIKSGLNNGKGGSVVCYMSIGEAEDYRYYFQKKWENQNLFDPEHSVTKNAPTWLDAENPEWPGNFKVRYWMQDWKNIIFGKQEAYLDKILIKGFDGVYLDIIDGYEFYEK